MEKEFKTIEEQVEILKKRNLIIQNKDKAISIFENNNYYYLINGYKDLFINRGQKIEIFQENATLEEIYSLYKFDSDLRMYFLKYILQIERKINTYIAYEFSKSYGHKNYLLEDNFDNTEANSLKIKELITDINNNMMKQYNNSNKMICHYLDTYQYVPLWVLIRILSFGEVSKFYRLMKQKEANAVSKKFNIHYKTLRIYLINLAIIRNICAHDEKLYDVRLKYKMPTTSYHDKLKMKKINGNYTKGIKDLFSIVIILKKLLPKKDFEDFYKFIILDIENLKKSITSININKILYRMGFPINYKYLLDL